MLRSMLEVGAGSGHAVIVEMSETCLNNPEMNISVGKYVNTSPKGLAPAKEGNETLVKIVVMEEDDDQFKAGDVVIRVYGNEGAEMVTSMALPCQAAVEDDED